MTRPFNTADRVVLLLSLIPYLREHGPVTVSELSAVFEVDERTLRELITFLGTAGVPGETHTYQPEDLFDIDWEAFEVHDVVSLTNIVAVDETPRFSSAEHAALLAGLHTLSVILPAEQSAIARQTAAKLSQITPAQPEERADAVDVQRDSLLSVSTDPGDPLLAIVSRAIDQKQRLHFSYLDLHGRATNRTVEPYELTQVGAEWYLRGYCLSREAERTFLVASMRDAEVSAERFEAPEVQGSRAPGLRSTIGPEDPSITATAVVRENVLHRLVSFSPKVIGSRDAGWLAVEVQLAHAATAIRLVQTAPGDVKIEAPEAARVAVRNWAQRALAHLDS